MIFAAGLGTRLKPLTDTIPKALVPLAGKPLLQWQIERLREAGIKDIVVNVHHFADKIIDAVQAHDGWGCSVQISDERDALLDTGGGLRKARKLLSSEPCEPILACNVDILSNIDLQALIDACTQAPPSANTPLAWLVVSKRDTKRYLLFDQDARMWGWTNIATGETKPSHIPANLSHFAFSGMQVLYPAIFDKMDSIVEAKGDKFSLIDLYLSLCGQETIKAYIPQNYRMMDVGKIDQIAEAERFAESLTK